jgi:cell fate regulator YaaT (PSP1 superfamily)
MPIVPLPQFEADAHLKEQADREAYARLAAPKSIVVRFGAMKLVGEFPYDGNVKPGCGSKLVVRTQRGVELGEMLTSTCSNSGCSKSVSRKEMLEYIENSGGRDYPFFSEGKVLRVATKEDLDKQAALEQSKHELRLRARGAAESHGFGHIKIVEVEPLLGGERMIVHFLAEERVEFRELGPVLSKELHTRVDLHPVGARDEARLTADYEKCGQYCCCKNFLKVLKPISMKSAKIQKATLDPLKISGRCGRLMCCLRYEDQTYDELRKKLPNKKKRVGTPEGDGIVIDSQILTQLVLVELDINDEMGRPKQVAVAVEDLTDPTNAVAPPRPAPPEFPQRGPRPSQPPRPPSGSPAGAPSGDKPQGGKPEGRGPDTRAPDTRGPDGRGPRPERRPDGPRDGQRDGQRDGRRDQRRDSRGPGGPPRTGPANPPPTSESHDINLDDIPTDDGTMDDRPPRGPGGPGGGPDRGPGGPGGRGPGGRRRRRRGPPGPGGGRGPRPGGPSSSGPSSGPTNSP